MKIEKIYARVRAGFKPMLAAVQKGAADSVKSDSDEKKSEKITFEGIRRLVREAVEDDVEDFNLRSAIRSAKDDGAQEGEIKAVLDASTNDEERIAMIQQMDAEYPATSQEEED